MTRIAYNPIAVARLRARSVSAANFDLVAVPRDVIVSPGSVEVVTVADAVYERHTGATIKHEHHLVVTPLTAGVLDAGHTFVSVNEAVATVNAAGEVTHVAGDDTVVFLCRTPFRSKGVAVRVWQESGAASDVFMEFAAGSLARHSADQIDGGATVDLSCVATNVNGTAISPRHVLFAKHNAPSTGATISFAGGVSRTLADVEIIGAPFPGGMFTDIIDDLAVGLLSSDLPESIVPATVLPSASYLSRVNHGVPALVVNRLNQVGTHELYRFGPVVATRQPEDADRAEDFVPIVPGDSGSPCGLVKDGEFVLTTLASGRSSTDGMVGPNITSKIAAINAAMTTLGGGYQVTEADLSGFATY